LNSTGKSRSARMSALWQDPYFRAKMSHRTVRPREERLKAKAAREARVQLRAERKAALQAKREARKLRLANQERIRAEKRTARAQKTALREARKTAPIPRLEESSLRPLRWSELRLCKVTLFENGKLVQRSWAEIGEGN